jgi:AcrR family transcriptional regulator/transposase-like protein
LGTVRADKLEVVQTPQRLGITVAETCRRYGISRETFYRWQRRYRAEGEAGLEERSSDPGPGVEEQVLDLRRQHPRWGARTIRSHLADQGVADPPATSTIHTMLKRNGLVGGTPTRRQTPRGTITRQSLLDAAMELWSATGWRGTGITAVAERAGVTDAGLLHHFDSKENFLLEVIAELDRRDLARWQDTGPPAGLDLIRQLPDWFRPTEGSPSVPADMWKLRLLLQAENLDPSSPAYEYFTLRHRFLHERFADAVRTGQARGEVRGDADPDDVAAQILAFVMGTGFHTQHGPKTIDTIAIVESFTTRLVRDLTSPAPTDLRG